MTMTKKKLKFANRKTTKKTKIRQSQNDKKKTKINHWTPFSAHGSGPGPSLGF